MERRLEGGAEKPRLILVDSSVWIDFFSPAPGRGGTELRRMIADAEPFALTGVVITEILQGLKRDASQIESYLRMWEMLEPRGFSTYREAAAIFRRARARGISLTTIDTLLAAIALEHGASVFTLDRDFWRVARVTNLALHQPSNALAPTPRATFPFAFAAAFLALLLDWPSSDRAGKLSLAASHEGGLRRRGPASNGGTRDNP